MFVKKTKGRVFGAEFTAAERKAMEMEIRRSCAEYLDQNAWEVASMVLWVLHEEFGFGEKRLRRFHDQFYFQIKELIDRYLAEDKEEIWICRKKLKESGFDIEQWERELPKE